MDPYPNAFDNFIGQKRIVSQIVPELRAALQTFQTAPHMIMHGPAGVGKDYLVAKIAQFLGAEVIEFMGTDIRDNTNWTWNTAFEMMCTNDPVNPVAGLDIAGHIINPELIPRWILMVNECEVIPRKRWEQLHSAVSPGPDGRRIFKHCINARTNQYANVWAPPFTLILLTNYLPQLRKNAMALLDRCPKTLHFQLYDEKDLYTIVCRYSQEKKVRIAEVAAHDIARRARGTPRRAKQLWDACDCERVLNKGPHILPDHVERAMQREGIEPDGLMERDLEYMAVLANGSAGIERLSMMLGLPDDMVEMEIEPWLLRQGQITVSGNGRSLTQEGMKRVARSGRCPNMRLA